MKPGAEFFAEIIGGEDPARVSEAADRAANLLVRGARDTDDPEVAERVLHLAETEGIETIAEVWAGLAGRLAGRLPVAAVRAALVGLRRPGGGRAGVRRGAAYRPGRAGRGRASPTRPGPDELRTMVDEVLRGIAGSEFADVLFRAAAFARVVATGRAALDDAHRGRGGRGCWCSPSSSRRRGTRSWRTGWRDGLRDLERWCVPDRERLTARGRSKRLILGPGAAAARHAQSL